MTKITLKSTSKTKPSTRFWDLENSTFSVGTVNVRNDKTREHQHVDNFSFAAASSPLETVYNVLRALGMLGISAKVEQSGIIPGLYRASDCRRPNSKTTYTVEMRLRAQPSLGLKYDFAYWKYYNAKAKQHK